MRHKKDPVSCNEHYYMWNETEHYWYFEERAKSGEAPSKITPFTVPSDEVQSLLDEVSHWQMSWKAMPPRSAPNREHKKYKWSQ